MTKTLFILSLLTVAMPALAEHIGPIVMPTERAPAEKSPGERLQEYFSGHAEKGAKVLLDPDYFSQELLFEPSKEDLRELTLTPAETKRLADRIGRVQEYLDNLKRRCIDGKPNHESSVELHRFITQWLGRIASGIEKAPAGPGGIIVRKQQLGELMGGIRKYLAVKAEVFPAEKLTYSSLDNALIVFGNDMTELLGGNVEEETLQAQYENPLKTALYELRNGKGSACIAGVVTADTTPATVDFSKFQFHGEPPPKADEIPKVEAGKSIEFSIPARDEQSGIEDRATCYSWFKDSKGKLVSAYGSYDAATGRCKFKLEINAFAPTGRLELDTIRPPSDRAGNEGREVKAPEGMHIAVDVAGKNADTTPASMDLSKFVFHTATPLEPGEIPKVDAGKSLEFSIPAKDDQSGIQNGAGCYCWFKDPLGRLQSAYGSYDETTGRCKLKLDVNAFAVPGRWIVDSVRPPTDRAGNEAPEIKPAEGKEIAVDVVSKNPDTTPPTADFSKFAFHPITPLKPGETLRLEAGKSIEMSIPVADENSGIPDGASGAIYFNDPNKKYVVGYGRYDAATGLLKVKLEIGPFAVPGIYTMDSVMTPSDRAGNSRSDLKPPAPITFSVFPAGGNGG